MKEYFFQEAQAVWTARREKDGSQLVGFHVHLSLGGNVRGVLAVAARTYYRLYVNGRMYAHGPARTAAHYCRVDRIVLKLSGEADLAVEVAAYAKPEKYCNDNTMEPGLFIAELVDDAGKVLTATGREGWSCQELGYRRMKVELMSQCRGIAEYYDRTPGDETWKLAGFREKPVICEEAVTYLDRRSPQVFFHAPGADISWKGRAMDALLQVSDKRRGNAFRQDAALALSRQINPLWYEGVPEENLFLEELIQEEDVVFSGTLEKEPGGRSVKVIPGGNAAAVLWKLDRPEVGYLDFKIRTEKEAVVDIVHSDVLSRQGSLPGNSYGTRYHLAPGEYHLTTFEPKLIKYAQFILRTTGEVRLFRPEVMPYTYPDCGELYFECDDGDLNRIYEAAKRTLCMNTLDIFMDCPQRERGGWLCDSYFSARAAWQLFGDLSVEQDFLENFMLTDADALWHGFFPEVYPGIRGEEGDVGICNWSFWLALEVCDYYARSGDREGTEAWRGRLERFVEGLLALRGESGLLEGLPSSFVDWSLSNSAEALNPISVPINCLAVHTLERMSDLYGREDWKEAAKEMRAVIEALPSDTNAPLGDGAVWNGETKALERKRLRTESGTALELFSGFHRNNREYVREFAEEMGPCPSHRPDPNIGKANLFIGLMIRFEVLAQLGKTELLIKELKDVYLEELRIGSGTLFEEIAKDSGCHGFNGYAAALIVNQVLGLGAPLQETKTIRISPHPGRLHWAGGSANCMDGPILLWWQADWEAHELKMRLVLPEGWTPEFDIPFEWKGWGVWCNERKLLV